jgi:hypothetical protein
LSRRGFLGASLAAATAAGLRAKERIAGHVQAQPVQAAAPAKPELKSKDYRREKTPF